MPIVPETKSWTWVLERACPDCGLDAGKIEFADVSALLREKAAHWPAILQQADVRVRPDETTWSPLEYSAHVRDVFRIFRSRLALMRAEDDPAFENWDQDATAVAERYGEQDPWVVSTELSDAAKALSADFEAVPEGELSRTARRSDGATFTIETLAQYFIHDPVHHLWDVTHLA